MARAINEVIYIRVNNPNLNRNVGKYNLPHLWNKVLFSISELKTKQMTSAQLLLCHMRFYNKIEYNTIRS